MKDNDSGFVLPLPPTTSNSYITTDWEYSGEIGFYSSFFAPLSIITLNNVGGTYSIAVQQSEYSALTHPYISITSAFNQYVATLKEYKIRYFLIDSSITSGIAETAKQSYYLVENPVNASFAKTVFVDGDLTIASINYNRIKSNKFPLDPEVSNTNIPQSEIYSYNQNTSQFQTSGVADAGNTVTFSVSGCNGTLPPMWSKNRRFLARSFYENATFRSQGIYDISWQLPNSSVLHVNYTVNKKMVAIIIATKVVSDGMTVYFTGGIFGGTTFSEKDYNWEWYINGVYNKSKGDASYDIPIVFNDTGTYNITLVMHDVLLEKTCVSIVLHVQNPPQTRSMKELEATSHQVLCYVSLLVLSRSLNLLFR